MFKSFALAMQRAATAGIMAVVLMFSTLGAHANSGPGIEELPSVEPRGRISMFFLNEELMGEEYRVGSLHVSAISIDARRGRRVWINGIERRDGEEFGPFEIVQISNETASIVHTFNDGRRRKYHLAVNQSVIFESESIAEGPAVEIIRKAVPRIRLP